MSCSPSTTTTTTSSADSSRTIGLASIAARRVPKPIGARNVCPRERPPRRLPLQARLRRHARAGPGSARPRGGREPLRRTRAPRPPAALGPAPGARRRARLVGRPQGHPARPGAQQPRRPHGGPPTRVHRLLGRDPGRPVRRGGHEDLGHRDLRDAQVPRGRGDGHLPRRAAARPLRPLPHPRRRLDDPPDGPARGRWAGAHARACRADAGADGELPADEAGWAFGIKGDGVRAMAYVDGGRLRLESRNGRDITPRYPELRELGRALGSRDAVLDGEVVAFDGGRPSFQKLQGRMHLASEHAVRRLAASDPVVYMIFDVVFLDGHSLMERSYEERRAVLAEIGLAGPTWQTPAHHVGDGAALLELSRAQGLEGIVAKRLDCPYIPGRRSPGWVKVKNVRRADVVIGGWLPGEGGRSGRLGALVVGFFHDGELRYAGRVGTGYTEAELARLGGILKPLARDTSPFSGRQPPKATRFVEPELVCLVEYNEITQAGTLRQPSYKGLRDDIAPGDVGPPED